MDQGAQHTTGNRHGLSAHAAGIETYLFSGIIILSKETSSPFAEVHSEGNGKDNIKLEWGQIGCSLQFRAEVQPLETYG